MTRDILQKLMKSVFCFKIMDYGQYLVLSIALTILLCSKIHKCPASLQQLSFNGNDQWLVLLRFLNNKGLTVYISGSLHSATTCTCISSYTLSILFQVWPFLHSTPTYCPPLQNFIINQQSQHSTLLPQSNLKSWFIQQNSYYCRHFPRHY